MLRGNLTHAWVFAGELFEEDYCEYFAVTSSTDGDGLQSWSVAVKRFVASQDQVTCTERADNRALIGESGSIPALFPLFVVVYVLKTRIDTSKENAAYALLSLSLVEKNKSSTEACGAISPLVALLLIGSSRGNKAAILTTLYKRCSIKNNKERVVSTGAVKPLVISLVAEQGSGLVEKAMVVLNSLVGIEQGKEAILEEFGIRTLVEAIEDGSMKGFAPSGERERGCQRKR